MTIDEKKKVLLENNVIQDNNYYFRLTNRQVLEHLQSLSEAALDETFSINTVYLTTQRAKI